MADRKWGQAYLTRDFFQRLGETMSNEVLLVVASEGGPGSPLVAGALNLIGSRTLFGRNWGSCYGRDIKNLHFELCYYQVPPSSASPRSAPSHISAFLPLSQRPFSRRSSPYLNDPCFDVPPHISATLTSTFLPISHRPLLRPSSLYLSVPTHTSAVPSSRISVFRSVSQHSSPCPSACVRMKDTDRVRAYMSPCASLFP